MKFRILWLASLVAMACLTAVVHAVSYSVALAQEEPEGSDSAVL